jgi:hypothetical protein
MITTPAAKLPSSRLWKEASYTNPPRFIIKGSTAHTTSIILTFLQEAFKDRAISYRITQGQICKRCFSVANASDYSRLNDRRTKSLRIVHKVVKSYGLENVSKMCSSLSDGLSCTAIINSGNSVYHLFLFHINYAVH